ncbi:DUF421 domain-containing protein [Domibacillus tundrae]|uniref:DUF421 domain-containing protein n=1 Tax=Domibacillus tundrae TaxID=1587527 RepID=UPI003393A649
MEFYHGQETLTVIQWVLRAITAFLFLLFAAKIMGQRSIAQLRLLDFIVAISIGNIIAHPLSDEKIGIKGTLVTMSAFVVLYIFGVMLSMKWQRFRNWVEPSPYPIIKNGQVIDKNLIKARISIDFLLSELRKGQIDGIEKVSLALWEPGGAISFFLSPQHQTVTPADLSLPTKPFSFQKTVIKEGKVDVNELNNLDKDEIWLKNKIKSTYNVEVKDILLATVDNTENVKIFLYQ